MTPGNGAPLENDMRSSLWKPFGLLALFLALILGILYWSYTLSLKNEIQNAGRIELLQVQQGRNILKDAVEERMSHLHQLGELPVVQYMDRPYLETRMSEWFRTMSHLGAVSLLRISPDGAIVATIGNSSAPDRRGFSKDLASARERGFPPKVSLKSGIDWSSGASPHITIIQPVYGSATNPSHPRASGRFTGLLVETIDANALMAGWPTAKTEDGKPDSSYYCILDGDGKFIIHTLSADLVGKPFDFGITHRPAGWRPLWPISDEGFRIMTVPDRPGVPGRKQLVAFTPLDVDGIRWTVYRHVPYSIATENLRRLFYVDLLLFLIACTGGIGMLFLYATRPSGAAHLPLPTRKGLWAGVLTFLFLILIMITWEIIERTYFPIRVVSGVRATIYIARGLGLGVIGAFVFYVLFTLEERAHGRALVSLRQSRESLLATLNSTSDGIMGVSYTPEGEIVSFCNRRFGEIFGLDPESVIGRPHKDVCAETSLSFLDPKAFQDDVMSLYQDRARSQISELEIAHPKRLTVERFTGPIYDDKGNVVGRILSFRDITEKKDLERQFLQAQKMEAIGTLTGGIAHDFNNILTGILGYADLLASKPGWSDDDRRSLEKIRQSSERAAAMVKHLMTFSRKSAPKLQVVGLNRLVEDIYPFCIQTIPKEIRIELDLQPDIPPVQADPVQIEQVILNLCVNARDAMPEGGSIRLRTRRAEQDDPRLRLHPEAAGDYVVLSISDTGHGMDEEMIKHIFEPFFTTKDVGLGTGLGLSVVHGIVGNHGGWIDVESAPGQGSQFVITLPATGRRESEAAPADSPPPGGRETILVVDDETTIRELGRSVLEHAGYRVLTASTGEEALRVFEPDPRRIDLVLLDWSMPQMGGRRTLEEILSRHPDTRVLITSGFLPAETMERALSGGAVGFLEKPFKTRELLQTVRQALDAPRVTRP